MDNATNLNKMVQYFPDIFVNILDTISVFDCAVTQGNMLNYLRAMPKLTRKYIQLFKNKFKPEALQFMRGKVTDNIDHSGSWK